jgi:gamma-glutamyltranspeptidase/glutathione hydrolase
MRVQSVSPLALALVSTVGCQGQVLPAARGSATAAAAPPPPPRVLFGRSKVATRYGIVATSQPLAARAGVQILERGGNTIDAAITTNAVMAA